MLKRLLISAVCFCLAIGISACLLNAQSASPAAPSESSGYTNSEVNEPKTAPEFAIPVSYQRDPWEYQDMHWVSNTKLIIVFDKKVTWRREPQIIPKLVVLYDLEDQSERQVRILGDTGWTCEILSDESEILIITSKTVYALQKADFSLISESPRVNESSADTFGGFSAYRDESGIVIQSSDQTTRVATHADNYFVQSPRWSPDGRYFLYSKLFRNTGSPLVNLCAADRSGNLLCEFEFNEYDYEAYWSDDSRHVIVTESDKPSGMCRLLDVESGKEIASHPLPYAGFSRSPRDIYKSTTVWWRENEEDKRYTVYTFDALTGENRDIAALGKYSEIKFSPDGSMLAVLEGQWPTQIQFYKSGL